MSKVEPPEPSIGDDMTVVVVHPNHDRDKDPCAKVGGKTAYIRAPNPEEFQPEFGQRVDVRVADIQDHNILLTLRENGDDAD